LILNAVILGRIIILLWISGQPGFKGCWSLRVLWRSHLGLSATECNKWADLYLL